MTQYSGVVNSIGSKYFPASPGKKAATLWSFALKGVDGFFGAGYQQPPFEKGDFISFSAEMVNGRLRADMSTIKKEQSVNEPVEAASAGSGPSASRSYHNKEDSRQKYIAWQAARKDALEFVALASGLNAIPKLPANPGKAAEALAALVEEYTLRFYQETFSAESKPLTPEEALAESDMPNDEDDPE